MKEQIIEILEDIQPEADYETCQTLIDDHILTSLDVLSSILQVPANNANEVNTSEKASKIKHICLSMYFLNKISPQKNKIIYKKYL